jgi:hypothetical protein
MGASESSMKQSVDLYYDNEIKELRLATQQAIDFNQTPMILYKSFLIPRSNIKITNLQNEFKIKCILVDFVGLPTSSRYCSTGNSSWTTSGGHEKTQILWKLRSDLPPYVDDAKS